MAQIKNIIIAGATGEVGRHLVQLAASIPALRVHALVRRTGTWRNHSLIHEVLFDYEDQDLYDELFQHVSCDVLMIALGTTTAKAGVQGLITVDRDYPIRLIEALRKANPGASVGFCSAAGADAPRGHYLKAKADVEHALKTSDLSTAIARPSFLISERAEFRPLERIGVPVFKAVFGVLTRVFPHSSGVWKYAPVRSSDVAHCLLGETLTLGPSKHVVLEGRRLHRDDHSQ